MSQHTTDDARGTERTGPDTVLELRDVSVSFPSSRGESRTLHDVDIEIRRGESLGVVGESGSGKSMFASVLNDSIVDPGVVNGDVVFYPAEGDPVDVTELGTRDLNSLRWEHIAVVPQGGTSVFNPSRDVRTHFQETLDHHDRERDPGMERARELLEQVNIDPEEVLDSYAHELSGGQKQRVLIALALLLDPAVLVMDEPTSALDLVMQRQVLNLLYEVREEYDLTIVFVSHDLPMVMGFSDRLAIMYAFEVVELGDAGDILENASHPYTRALLRTVPSLSGDFESLEPIEGETPDPVNLPTGCSYHTRCPLADERCAEEDPALIDVEEGHAAACFYADQAADAVTLSFGGESE
jgi:oligopeptide/dipeptide ABC transporter ATP-binding protein